MPIIPTIYRKPDHVLAAHGNIISMDFDMMFDGLWTWIRITELKYIKVQL
jgi:hypothetical protein